MYDGPIIDVDVHHARRTDVELLEYMPKRWRDYMTSPETKLGSAPPPSQPVQPPIDGARPTERQGSQGRMIPLMTPNTNADHPGGTNKRHDAFPEDGSLPGTSLQMLQDQHLDPYRVEHACLTYDIGQEAALPNGELALAVCSALNDWTVDRWLNQDHRVAGSILTPTHFPDRAAAEIRRSGKNERFCNAMLPFNALGQPIGHPVYSPIYEAAADMGLPIFLHAGLGEFMGASAPHTSGGFPHNSRFELMNAVHQSLATHLTSVIVHGVFERFPTLTMVVAESGLAWLPWLCASLDSNYGLMKRESRWVRKRPSQYLRDRVFLSTQPCEAHRHDRDAFIAHMSLVEGIEGMLCFSSDYPHWDADAPTFIDAIFPDSWHEKLFSGNARRALRIPLPPPRSREREAVSA